MRVNTRWLLLLLFLALPVRAQDAVSVDDTADESAGVDEEADDRNGDGIGSPRSMSGMSILGNEEARKSLVIIPWMSSELGDDIVCPIRLSNALSRLIVRSFCAS